MCLQLLQTTLTHSYFPSVVTTHNNPGTFSPWCWLSVPKKLQVNQITLNAVERPIVPVENASTEP